MKNTIETKMTLSLSETIIKTANENPRKIALSDIKESISYDSLIKNITKISYFLMEKIKLKRGDAIGIILPNCNLFVKVHLSIVFSGFVSVPLSTEIMSNNLTEIIKITKLKCIFSFVEIINKNLLEDVIKKNKIFFISDIELKNKEIKNCTLKSFIHKDHFIIHKFPKINLQDPISYMFTSGSTGKKKCVVLTHKNVLSAIKNTISFVGYDKNYYELITLPIYHNFGLGHIYCNLFVGGKVSILPGFSNFNLLFNTLFEKRPKGFPGTPSGFKILLQVFPKKFLLCKKFLKLIIINSEPVPPSLLKQLVNKFPSTRILVYYGLTEASRSSFIEFSNKTEEYLFNSVGKATPNVELKIVDKKKKKLKVMQEGTVCIKGDHVMKSYLNIKKKEYFKKRWFHTDDIGFLDKKNNLFLTGRKSRVINKEGLKFDPVEIENFIKSFNGIKQARIHLDKKNKIVCSIVVIKSKFKGLDNLKKYCFRKLEKSKIPSNFQIKKIM